MIQTGVMRKNNFGRRERTKTNDEIDAYLLGVSLPDLFGLCRVGDGKRSLVFESRGVNNELVLYWLRMRLKYV